MRIGLYHEPVHTDGRTYDTHGGYARYVLEFARYFEQVIVFAPTTSQPTYFSGYALEAPNVTVAPLPYFDHHRQAYRLAPAIIRVFRQHAPTLDVIEVRGTAPLAYVLWWLTRRRRVPFIYHFASDPFEAIARTPKYHGLYGYFAWAAYSFEFAIQKYIMRRNYSVTDGGPLGQQLRRYSPNVEGLVHSTLAPQDYYQRQDSCTGPVVRVLFVGALRDWKRVNDLVEAVAILQDQVHFRGVATQGPELNARYNAADIFSLPSLSEGSPRVVLEALGHSLPVVATPVGNIPELLGDGRRGVLVPLKNPPALAAGIARLIDDGEFRRQCIRESYAYAREHGLEAFVGHVASKARALATAAARRHPPC
jgi:glycosyltransferase involved in cell wall biosynthesis